MSLLAVAPPKVNLTKPVWETLLWHDFQDADHTFNEPLLNLVDNVTIDKPGRYAKLFHIEEFRCDPYGEFQFKITYPETGEYVQWKQTSNPTDVTIKQIEGFKCKYLITNAFKIYVHTDFSAITRDRIDFQGLMVNNNWALIGAEPVAPWYSVGAIRRYRELVAFAASGIKETQHHTYKQIRWEAKFCTDGIIFIIQRFLSMSSLYFRLDHKHIHHHFK